MRALVSPIPRYLKLLCVDVTPEAEDIEKRSVRINLEGIFGKVIRASSFASGFQHFFYLLYNEIMKQCAILSY